MDLEKIQLLFTEIFHSEPDIIVQVPGRVNLIGEHTDYNDGFVFPAAIDRYITIVARRRNDRKVILYALDFDSITEFSLDSPIQRSNSKLSWSNYTKGVAHEIFKAGYNLCGCEALITGDIPIAVGLSSSAALEIASALMFLNLSAAKNISYNWNNTEIALLCQRAENQFVGVNCGIMDPFTCLHGSKNQALFLDCRSLDFELVPLNFDDIKIVVSNTKVKRELENSEYNQRRAECERGVNILRRVARNSDIIALRDVSSEMFNTYAEHLPLVTEKRCSYVIEENMRVKKGIKALKSGDLTQFGALMKASHEGLKDKYEVSSPELNLLVEIANDIKGVIGTRMTGAGFGGCTVSLVYSNALGKFTETVKSKYQQLTGIKPEIYVCNVDAGAKVGSVRGCLKSLSTG
jgi:galactokinase